MLGESDRCQAQSADRAPPQPPYTTMYYMLSVSKNQP